LGANGEEISNSQVPKILVLRDYPEVAPPAGRWVVSRWRNDSMCHAPSGLRAHLLSRSAKG